MTKGEVRAYIMERLQCDIVAARNIIAKVETKLSLVGKGEGAFELAEKEVLAMTDALIRQAPAFGGRDELGQGSLPFAAGARMRSGGFDIP